MPQPNFVPFKSRTSRSTHSSGMSAGTSTVFDVPLTLNVMAMDLLLNDGCTRPAFSPEVLEALHRRVRQRRALQFCRTRLPIAPSRPLPGSSRRRSTTYAPYPSRRPPQESLLQPVAAT